MGGSGPSPEDRYPRMKILISMNGKDFDRVMNELREREGRRISQYEAIEVIEMILAQLVRRGAYTGSSSQLAPSEPFWDTFDAMYESREFAEILGFEPEGDNPRRRLPRRRA